MTDTSDASNVTTTEVTTTETSETAVDLAAEVEKWKALSKKNEERAKGNAQAAKELEEFRRQSMTDQEKAVADARAQARLEALTEVGGKVAAAELRAAAAGRMDAEQIDALLEGINLARFLDETGEVDRGALAAFVDRIAPPPGEDRQSQLLDLGQGARTPNTALNGDPLIRGLRNLVGPPRH